MAVAQEGTSGTAAAEEDEEAAEEAAFQGRGGSSTWRHLGVKISLYCSRSTRVVAAMLP